MGRLRIGKIGPKNQDVPRHIQILKTMVEKNETMPKGPSFDQLAEELRLEELEKCLSGKEDAAFKAAESRFALDDSDPDKAGRERLPDDHARRYTLFKLLVHEKKGRLRWQALKEQNPGKRWDTDAKVLELWQKLDSEAASKELSNCHWSVIYHRLWLFEWLLRRYNVRRAREVVGGTGRVAQNAHLFLFSVVLAFFVLRPKESPGADGNEWAFVFCGLAYAVVLATLAYSFRNKLPDRLEAFAVATHSLIPRLAGAGAVGLVILASSAELLNVVIVTNWWWLIGLLLAGYVYLLLEMSRRVHPMPRPRRLVVHGLDVAATAFAHSMTLVLLAEGGLRRVLTDEHGNPAGAFSLWQSLSIVVFVFTIGLVVNLIWAEQPVTEPL